MAKGQIKQKQATISQSQFESLCAIQCTREEICAVLNVSDKTLDRWCQNTYGKYFSAIFAEKRQLGKVSLRRSQWRMAEKDKTMSIWLGKQYLGQRDSFPDEVNYTEINKGIQNIANLINNPVKERKEDEIEEDNK